MKKGKLLAMVGAILVIYFGFCALTWAAPGDEKWFYSSAGGNWNTSVVINSQGYRILGTTAYSGSNSHWVVGCVDKDGNYMWQKTYSGPEDTAFLGKIALDHNDNLIAAGFVKEGSKYIWHVISYKSQDGSINWEKDFDVGDTSSIGYYAFVLVTDLAIDNNNNIIVSGLCVDSSKLLGYVLSLDPSGNKNWDVKLGNNGSYVMRVTTDSKNNVLVGGLIMDSSSLGDWYVLSFSPSGGKNWEKTLTSSGGDSIGGIVVDSHDDIIVAGSKYRDFRVVKFSSTGNILWEETKNWDPNKGSYATSVTVDSKDNVVVAGTKNTSSTNRDFYIVSYSPSGGKNWEIAYNGPGNGSDEAAAVAVDKNDNVFVVGFRYTDNSTHLTDWMVQCISPSGTVEWTKFYDSGSQNTDYAEAVAIDPSNGDVVVAGPTDHYSYARIIDYEGYLQPSTVSGHILVPSEVRTIQPAPETPDPDNGKYLGFGDVVANGTHFKVEAAFPTYLKESDNSTLAVKIFIAAQMPDDYSRLAYFDSSNNLKFQPPEKLSSWKASVSGEVAKTTVMPEVDVTSAFSSIPAGTHYWYTLVVPDTVPDDFAGVDWATTPWEITVNIFEVNK